MKIFIQILGWFLGFTWKAQEDKPQPVSPNIMDRPLLKLGEHDVLTLRDGASGILVSGATGSGKSSSVAMHLIEALFTSGLGGLVHTCKASEVDHILACAERFGRLPDMILLGPNDHHLNFMQYEGSVASSSALTENLVQLLLVVLNADVKAGQSTDAYWEHSKRQLLRNCIALLQLSGRDVTIASMLKLINTAAQHEAQVYDEAWRSSSFCFACISEIEAIESPDTDRNTTANYWLTDYPSLSSRTRSVVVSSVTSLLDVFCRGVLAQTFCTDSTFNPEAIFEGKIIVNALSVHEYADLGIRSQALVKMLVERMINRRKVIADSLPVFILADESHYFFLKDGVDMLFASTARSLRCINISITQSISNYLAVCGQGREAEVKSLFANHKTHIFLNNGSVEHNRYASDCLSQSQQWKLSITGQDNGKGSYSLGEQFLPEQAAIEFQHLKAGGQENEYQCEAIVWNPNKVFEATSKPWLKTSFKQQFIN